MWNKCYIHKFSFYTQPLQTMHLILPPSVPHAPSLTLLLDDHRSITITSHVQGVLSLRFSQFCHFMCWSLYICWGFLLMIYLIISYSLCRPYDSSQCGVGIGLHRNLRTPCTPTNKDQQQCTNYMNGIAVLTLCCVPATCSATSRPCWWSGGGKSQNPGDSWWSDSASIPVRWMSSVVPLSVL